MQQIQNGGAVFSVFVALFAVFAFEDTDQQPPVEPAVERVVADVEPEDLTIATVPGLVAERGDAWATIDDDLQSLDPLLEWHERDWANGLPDAPWPPVYPKMPNEPPRVSPSRAKQG